MTTELAVIVTLVFALAACSKADLLASSSPAVAAGAPPDIHAACALASGRCSQCHSLDPVIALQPGSPDEWRRYVRRMRHMPGSAIADDEEAPIVSCLVYRSFGLAAARAESP